MSSLRSSLIFYLRSIACGFTEAFCLHESGDVQHTAYGHTPTNSFEAGKIAVAFRFLAAMNLWVSCVLRKNQMDQNKTDRKTKWKSYNCASRTIWQVARQFFVLHRVGRCSILMLSSCQGQGVTCCSFIRQTILAKVLDTRVKKGPNSSVNLYDVRVCWKKSDFCSKHLLYWEGGLGFGMGNLKRTKRARWPEVCTCHTCKREIIGVGWVTVKTLGGSGRESKTRHQAGCSEAAGVSSFQGKALEDTQSSQQTFYIVRFTMRLSWPGTLEHPPHRDAGRPGI